MFYLKELREAKELCENLKEQYLKLRKEHYELLSELDKIKRQDEKIEVLEWTIEKLSMELDWKTQLVTEYHLRFGEECAEIIEEKRLTINKRTSKKHSDDN